MTLSPRQKAALLALALCTFALTLSGCRSTPPPAASTSAPQATPTPATLTPAAPLDPATLGSITGSVHLTGKAPAPVKIDTSMDPACGFGAGDTFSEQYVVQPAGKDNRLANVFVYVKSGPAIAMATGASNTPPVVLDQKGCVYTPHVIAILQGGSVEFHNDDPTMHNIHAMPTTVGNEPIDISQGPHGTPQVKRFLKPELMIPVRCNNHPWMNAFINVSATPFFAVTAPGGTFELKNMPAGDYVLGFVHEKLGEQTVSITVKPHAASAANATFTLQ